MPLSRKPLPPTPSRTIWLTPKAPILFFLFMFLPVCLFIFIIFFLSVFFSGSSHIAITPTFTIRSSPTIRPTSTNLPTATRRFTSTATQRVPTRTPKPAVTLIPTLTPTVDIWKDCRASYKSRLQIGDFAYVSHTPPLRNRVRSGPDVNSKIIGHIAPGEQVEIIDGPSCSNNWIWWKVRVRKNGQIGWTAEGDANNYWLVPSK